MTPESMTPPVVAFVIAYWDDGKPWQREYLRLTLDSIVAQTDPNWRVYVVNDASPEPSATAYLDALTAWYGERFAAIHSDRNGGCGPARNRALPAVERDGGDVIAWLDADDLAHPDRVAVLRRMFAEDPELEVVYNSIEFIDENGNPWAEDELLPSLRLLAREQAMPVLRGRDRWVDVAVERENVAIPSAMSARLSLARRFPFPDVRFCEDVATWFRFLGSGAKLDHADGSTLRYRVPRVGGSASRVLAGDLEYFNRLRCGNERAGLVDAIEMATARGVLTATAGRSILCRYLIRIARTVSVDGHVGLATEQYADARSVDPTTFGQHATPEEQRMAEQVSVTRDS
ncbi:glycosyltransferase family A protein [Actinoplanes sp. NPDC049265]|uniref:glycosyltransferase family A protein n=1 Tax=Actinoplanes sp. NPDC049265 TaxID=3363902 RepID=UPI00371DA158